mmetsp:Transcript_55278/g.131294  ORF Transcript_55278/g.131294 Transcript_55278/m.131294 type:complete len:124 (-) Transcript_55278:72-443(-)
MILLTHNMLASPMKEAGQQLPLGIEASEIAEKEREYNQEFLAGILVRVDWDSFLAAATTLGHAEGLPATKEEVDESDDDVMKKVHHALLEVDVIAGSLICTETGRKFPISGGIPNMLLHQDEL